MENHHSWDIRWGIAIAVGLAAALVGTTCIEGEMADPRRLAEMEPAPDLSFVEYQLLPAVGNVVTAARPPAAPVGEFAGAERTELRRERVQIAVGENAAGSIDASLRDAFARFEPSLAGDYLEVTDRDAIELLMLGKVDLALVGGKLSPRDLDAGLRATTLGVELFALVVAPGNPVRSLTADQVRQVFTGRLRDWSELGLPPGPIVPVVPSQHALAERAQRALMPGDAFAPGCIHVASERHVVDQLLREPGAIGVVRLDGVSREQGQRVVQIDWVDPSLDNFANGNYPFGTPLQLIAADGKNARADALLAFARGDDGRRLLGRTLATRP
ncbi:MAG: substrate-binding domain-containing protein [Planctomycetes bacterium]|nr:substrate-binding domain-containing protein [Planctomycetota bacterium]